MICPTAASLSFRGFRLPQCHPRHTDTPPPAPPTPARDYWINCHNCTPKTNMAMHRPSTTTATTNSVDETPLEFIGFSSDGTCTAGNVVARLLWASWPVFT